MIDPLLIALRFLTRLPVPEAATDTDRQIGQSLLYYPIVGLIIGSMLALMAWMTEGDPVAVRAALLLVTWTLITGALHLDGLADSADAWIGGYGDKERTLAIMKDPYVGPAGVTIILLVLLCKYASLQALLNQNNYPGLIFVPLLARAMIPLLLLTTDYVRKMGLVSALAANVPRHTSRAVVIISAVLAVLFNGSSGIWLLATLAIVFLYLRQMMIQRLQGTTGDTIGAMVEISEAAGLMILAIVVQA